MPDSDTGIKALGEADGKSFSLSCLPHADLSIGLKWT